MLSPPNLPLHDRRIAIREKDLPNYAKYANASLAQNASDLHLLIRGRTRQIRAPFFPPSSAPSTGD